MAEPNPSNYVALKEYFDRVLQEKDKAIELALLATKEASNAAEINSEKWRNNANEWRAAMTDRERRFLSKDEYIVGHDNLERRVEQLWDWRNTMAGKADSSALTRVNMLAVISFVSGALGIAIGLIGLLSR